MPRSIGISQLFWFYCSLHAFHLNALFIDQMQRQVEVCFFVA